MQQNEFTYSFVLYRRNPADPTEGELLLGVALEFVTDDYWVVALGMCDPIAEEILEEMDPLTKELLQRPTSILDHEVGDAINQANRPGDVLKGLSASNMWSIYVTAPERGKIATTRKARKASVYEMVDKYFLESLSTKLTGVTELPASVGSTRHAVSVGSTRHDVPTSDPGELWRGAPTPWMRTFVRPSTEIKSPRLQTRH